MVNFLSDVFIRFYGNLPQLCVYCGNNIRPRDPASITEWPRLHGTATPITGSELHSGPEAEYYGVNHDC